MNILEIWFSKYCKPQENLSNKNLQKFGKHSTKKFKIFQKSKTT